MASHGVNGERLLKATTTILQRESSLLVSMELPIVTLPGGGFKFAEEENESFYDGRIDSETTDIILNSAEEESDIDEGHDGTSDVESDSSNSQIEEEPFPHGTLVWVPSQTNFQNEQLGVVVHPGREFRVNDQNKVLKMPSMVKDSVAYAFQNKYPVFYLSEKTSFYWDLIPGNKMRKLPSQP